MILISIINFLCININFVCINLFIDYTVKFYSNAKFRVSKEYERNFELAINTDSFFLSQFINTRINKTKNTSDNIYINMISYMHIIDLLKNLLSL